MRTANRLRIVKTYVVLVDKHRPSRAGVGTSCTDGEVEEVDLHFPLERHQDQVEHRYRRAVDKLLEENLAA